MFAYPCPFCQQRLLASPERVGQRTICPKCMKPIVIPRPDGTPIEEGRVTVPQLLGDSPSTIFVDEHHEEKDEADAMDLSLPPEHEEFSGFVNDSAELLPPLEDAPPPAPLEVPSPVASSDHVGSFTPSAMAMAAAGVVQSTAAPQISGVGAAYALAPETPRPDIATPPPRARDHGVVMFQPSTGESADIAAELTAALTMRMKPPPEPPSDLRLSTGAWLALTAGGLSLWLLSMMGHADVTAEKLLIAVAAIGVLEVIVSYIWVAYLSGRKSTQRGLEALLPPVWLARMAYPASNNPGYRPLRFAVAGSLLILLASLGDRLRPVVQRVTGEPETATVPIPPPVHSPLARLKASQTEGTNRHITEALTELATEATTFTSTPAETRELLAEIRRLRNHENGEVRGAALIALKKWAGLDAVKPDVIKVLRQRSAETHERRAALDLAREFKDRDVTRAVALCLGHPSFGEDTDRRAADTLRAIGPPEAEEALLELFENDDLRLRGLSELLAELGGPTAIERLRQIAAMTSDNELREDAQRTADKIAARPDIRRK